MQVLLRRYEYKRHTGIENIWNAVNLTTLIAMKLACLSFLQKFRWHSSGIRFVLISLCDQSNICAISCSSLTSKSWKISVQRLLLFLLLLFLPNIFNRKFLIRTTEQFRSLPYSWLQHCHCDLFRFYVTFACLYSLLIRFFETIYREIATNSPVALAIFDQPRMIVKLY